MFQKAIEELRAGNGAGPVERYDARMSHFCHLHARAMACAEKVYPSDYCYQENWQEAVGRHARIPKMNDAIRAIILTLFGRHDAFRDILINSKELAIGSCESDGYLYVTIRGR